MKIKDCCMMPDIPPESLAFSMFPDFLRWMASDWKELTFFLKRGFGQWKEVFSQEFNEPEIAEFAAYLLVFVNLILDYDKSKGVLDDDAVLWLFGVWQELIVDTIHLCDAPPKMVTQSKTFHV